MAKPNPTLKDLAEILHDKLCRYDHNDQCAWLYENDREDPWKEWTHRRYFEQAFALTNATDLPNGTIIKVIENLQRNL